MKIKDNSDTTYKILCNKCGNEIEKKEYFADWLEINKRWGYDSDYDNCVHSFDICQKCYTEFISQFNIGI